MAAKLVAEEGILKELVLSLEEGDHWVIGRDPDACQLLVEDPSASRKHVLCRKTTEGIVLENLSSTNPVQVNEEEVTQPRLLHNGDTVRIGGSLFRFYTLTGAQVFDEENPPVTTGNGSQPIPEKSATASAGPLPELDEEEKHDSIYEEESEEKAEIAQVNFDLMETGRWLLKVVGGPNSGAEFSMQAGNTYLLGTDPNVCDIVFHDNSVSRQHVRIVVSPEDTLTIEDLKSRNGTRIDGELIEGRRPLLPQTLVLIGTTTFTVYDREGEMQTIISPLLPSIVKALQQEEPAKSTPQTAVETSAAVVATPLPATPVKPKSTHALGTFIVLAILVGLFVVVGFGITTLFHQEPIVAEKTIDTGSLLDKALSPFSTVKYSFNKATGHLLLVGHVLSSSDRNELMYNLQGLGFIKDIDDSGVIIDEYVWTEANQLLGRNPAWKGVTVHATTPGRFVLSGLLQTRQQAEQLWDYITRNFAYLDLLENRVIVEEDILNNVKSVLNEKGFHAIKPELVNGELSLTGNIPEGTMPTLKDLVSTLKETTGVRNVNNYVTEVAPQEAVVNISEKYTISGFSKTDSGNLTVIINGRILTQGDILDGMKIVQITSSSVYLEKDGIRYRIDSK